MQSDLIMSKNVAWPRGVVLLLAVTVVNMGMILRFIFFPIHSFVLKSYMWHDNGVTRYIAGCPPVWAGDLTVFARPAFCTQRGGIIS